MKRSDKNRFWSIRTSNGTVKNYTVFSDGAVTIQYIGTDRKVRTKYLGNIN